MAGICSKTGKVIERPEHIKQSIQAILSTPIGTRVMRRSFGFGVLEENGRPESKLTGRIVEEAAAAALAEYEPRIVVEGVFSEIVGEDLRQITVSYRDIASGKQDQFTVAY